MPPVMADVDRQEQMERDRKAALAKLTPYERKLLGLGDR